MITKMTSIFVFIIITIYSSFSLSETLDGRVLVVTDGDTVKVLHDKRLIKIRLSEVDAPESSQPFGKESKQKLSDLIYDQLVSIDVVTVDRYGRVVGRIWMKGIDINAAMVRQGYAWVYVVYSQDESLYTIQRAAKEERRGLWVDSNPVEPWLWRRGMR